MNKIEANKNPAYEAGLREKRTQKRIEDFLYSTTSITELQAFIAAGDKFLIEWDAWFDEFCKRNPVPVGVCNE